MELFVSTEANEKEIQENLKHAPRRQVQRVPRAVKCSEWQQVAVRHRPHFCVSDFSSPVFTPFPSSFRRVSYFCLRSAAASASSPSRILEKPSGGQAVYDTYQENEKKELAAAMNEMTFSKAAL